MPNTLRANIANFANIANIANNAKLANIVNLTSIAIAALSLAMPIAAHAQIDSTAPRHWELRITSGALIPVGDQREQLQRAPLSALQVSWLPSPAVAVTGTFAWAKSRDLASERTPRVTAYTADLGVESRPAKWETGERLRVSPFVGAGLGARSYDYVHGRSAARHNVAAYGAIGAELGFGRVALRVEAREYVGGFTAMDGVGPNSPSSDLVMMTSLRFTRRAAARR